MTKKKNIRISKYDTIAKAIGVPSSAVANYINGVSYNSTSLKAEKIRKASDYYDKEMEKFKMSIELGIQKEIEKIE